MLRMNGTTEGINETMHCQSTQNRAPVFLGIVMITDMIVGLPAGIVALWIFCFRMKCWKPHTLFLFNLLLADFLLLISLPFRIHSDLLNTNWVFGHVWCRINLFMLAVNRSASIAFMTVVGLDRYLKVVHPHHCISHMSSAQAGWFAGLIWTVVIAVRIPLLTTKLLHESGNISLCRSFNSYDKVPWQIQVHYGAFIAEFFLPWFLLLYCSARIAHSLYQRRMDRQKRVRRAIRAVGVISLVFTICFMPSILTGLGGIYIHYFYPNNCPSYNLITQLFVICIGFTYLNSALDPIIYSFSSSMFCDALKSSISCLGFMKKNTRPTNNRGK